MKKLLKYWIFILYLPVLYSTYEYYYMRKDFQMLQEKKRSTIFKEENIRKRVEENKENIANKEYELHQKELDDVRIEILKSEKPILILEKNYEKIEKQILVEFLFAALISYIIILYRSIKLRNKERTIKDKEIGEIKGRLEQDFITSMVKINLEQIEQYYKEILNQANKSFNIACIAAISGGIFLLKSFLDKQNEMTLITGIMGVVIEFISVINFGMYTKTMGQMGESHKKLIATQNIVLALKVIEKSNSEDKEKLEFEMIKGLLKDINKFLLIDGNGKK